MDTHSIRLLAAVFAVVFGVMSLGVVPIQTADAQCYEQAVSMRFKPLSAGPPYSFVYAANMTRTVMRSRRIPRIIVQILDSDGNVDSETNSVDIVASSTARIGTDGSTVSVFRGEAHFENLVPEDTSETLPLTFTALALSPLNEAKVQGAKLSTANFTVLTQGVDVWALAFRQNYSYILLNDQAVNIVFGAKIPTIRVQIITSEYKKLRTELRQDSNFTIAVRMDTPADGVPVTISGRTALSYDGEATFSDIILTSATGETTLPPLIFYLDRYPDVLVKTGSVKVVRTVDYSNIAFLDQSKSFIYGQGQEFTATVGVPLPPIRIGLVDNLYQLSPVRTGLVITASCDRGRLEGSVVGVVDGIATFDGLQFIAVFDTTFKPLSITFTAGNQGALPLAGDTLKTGVVKVSSVVQPATSLMFMQSSYDSLFNAEGQSKQVVFFLTLPAIRIRLLSSSNEVDTATSMTISVATSTGSRLTASTTQVAVRNGVALFDNLVYSTSSTTSFPRLTFTALDNTTVAAYQTYITTGTINVTTIQRNFDLRFQSYGASLFPLEGIASFGTIGTPLPPIVVELTTSAETLDSSSDEIGITVTSEGADVTNSFLRVSSGVAIFSELTFVSEVPGTYTLTFTAGSDGAQAVSGKQIMSGEITISATATYAYGTRFSPDGYFRFTSHVMPITQNVAIPDIIIDLLRSDHVLDTTSTGVRVAVSVSSGVLSGVVIQNFYNGKAVFSGLRVTGAFDPILTFCASSDTTVQEAGNPVDGRCVSTGTLTFNTVPSNLGTLKFLNGSNIINNGVFDSIKEGQAYSIDEGGSMRVAVAIADSSGVYQTDRFGITLPAMKILLDSTIQLVPPLSVSVDTATGIAVFDSLQFATEIPAGVTPIITFTAKLDSADSTTSISPIATGLISVSGTSGLSGVDVVAEVLSTYRSFSFDAWRIVLCKRFSIETARIIMLKVDEGTGDTYDSSAITEDNAYSTAASWSGTRVELRILEPLPTSRNTKKASEISEVMLAMKEDCDSGELKIRKIYLKASDTSCDFNVYDDQQNAARQCIETQGKDGYCSCFVPMFNFFQLRCLGYEKLTTLCLDTLLAEASCNQPEITKTCNLLQFADTPRTAVAGSGMFLFLFFPPLLYMYSTGYFVRLARPNTKRTRIPIQEANNDEMSAY